VIYPALRPALFGLDPERAHALSLQAMRTVGSSAALRTTVARTFRPARSRPVTAFGLTFPNPVGLAAGYDKDGEAWRGLACLGFGHIEVGTVTPEPQPGNPRPRVFRLVEDRSLINRMGFPGRGAAWVAERLRGRPRDGTVLGVNIGKQKATPLEEAVHDYEELIDVFAPLADYLAVNISSPNTPGLRRLQERAFLESLLGALAARRAELRERLGRSVPVLVKLAPDLDDAQLDAAIEALLTTGMDGVIATNTTLAREGLRSPLAREEGGLSGAALTARAAAMIGAIARRTAGRLPIVAVGGIMDPDDARARLDAGAVLVQLYTGLVYEGPGLVRRVVEALA
jgi:dihydroorotate dehydrogenase